MDKIYDERFQLYVLHMIKNESDISKIVGSDFDYRDISKIINILKIHGKVSSLEGELGLTSEGEKYYKQLLKSSGVSEKGPIILPQFQYFNRKIGKFDIYLKK